MELRFDEIHDEYHDEYQDQANTHYWQEPEKPKKKKVSFDDILSNMNLVVNKQGVLQYMQSQPVESDVQPHAAQIDPFVKHTYIYNKYFKNYSDPSMQQSNAPMIPKTKEEYYQMLLEERKKKIELMEHLRKTKPKHLLLTSSPGMSSQNIQASRNNLFKMQFK